MKVNNILTAFIIIVIIIFTACTFNEPVLPNWETIWDLPLPDISFVMSEAIDNESVFADTTLQGVPILSLSIRDSVNKEGIDRENLSIKPEPETLATTINNINISSPGKESTDPVSIHNFLGFTLQQGDTVTVAPDTIISLPAQIVLFTNYQYVFVSTGKLILEFHNQTFLNIRGGMQIDLYDDSTNQFIGTSTFQAINAYSSEFANDSLDIGGRLISQRLRLESQVPLQQMIHTVSTQDTSGFIQTDVCISHLMVEEAIANIPEQTASETGAESVEDNENKVIEAIVDEGRIHLNIENQLKVEATVTVTLPNFEEQPGTTFSQSQIIRAESNDTTTIDLSDLRMFNYKFPGMTIDSLHYEVTVITRPSLGLTRISNDDSVVVKFDADSIFFREFEGEIDTVEVAIDTVKQEEIFNYNGFEGGIHLKDLELDLTIFNELGISFDIFINIRGERRNPDTRQLENFLDLDPVLIHVLPGASGLPSTNSINLKGSNSKIIELMDILPTDIVMSGSATIWGETDPKITINDSIWGEYEISSPFNVFVDSIPDFESDLETLDELDEDIKDAIENKFQNANLEMVYENGLPLAANVIIIFATDTTDFFEIDTSDTNKLIIDDLKIGAGTIGTDGYVSLPFNDRISPFFSEKEVKIFSSDELYFGSKIEFPDVNKEMKFRSTDALTSTGSIKFKVFMNPKDE
jgi:hypothetical protein